MFENNGIPAVSFEELALEAAGLSYEEPVETEILATNTCQSIAIVLYTSGSTGIPKGKIFSSTS